MDRPRTDSRPLKVALICHSDTLGGASVVTYRLMHALRSEGVDARMVVFNKMSNDEYVIPTGQRLRRGATFMSERIGIAMSNGLSRENLFKVSTASAGMPLHQHPWVKEADVIALSWINQGLLSLKGIRRLARLGKPIVWTMHDMWNLTGICHHAYECRGYKHSCGNCQFLTGGREQDLSRKVWLKKQKLYADVPITFVAVSNWLADCCRKSELMAKADVRVIPNAFPVDSFITKPAIELSGFSMIPAKNVILMGAARIDDAIKGVDYAIDALNYIFDNNPQLARESMALFFGEVRDRSIFNRLRFPHQLTGRVHDGKILRHLYASANVVLSTSLYETLPGTLIEGQAAGCLPVSFGRGGQSDIIEHKVNGFIAEYKNPISVAEGIEWALQADVDRDALHESVRARFSAKSVAQRYMALFEELLQA